MILHVLAPGLAGGLESVVRLLAGGQRARGHLVAAVLVVDPGCERHPLGEALAAAGVRVETIVVPPRAYRHERRALAGLFARLRPSVVHTHGYRADVLASGVARRAGAATVTTVHGFTGGGWKNRLYESLQRRAYRRYDAVVAVSAPLAAQLVRDGVPARLVHRIPNAFVAHETPLARNEARALLGIPPGPPSQVLGWVGRLSGEKCPDVFVRAVALVRDLPVTASIVGGGRERPALEALAAELGVADRVRFHGLVPDAGRLYRAFDAFVLSSRTEGTPMAIFEAMAAGVPIVTTAVGGVPDVVGPGEARLVPPLDPPALAAAIRDVVTDPGAAALRAAAARARLGAEFAPGPWLDRYDALYASVRPSLTAGVTATA